MAVKKAALPFVASPRLQCVVRSWNELLRSWYQFFWLLWCLPILKLLLGRAYITGQLCVPWLKCFDKSLSSKCWKGFLMDRIPDFSDIWDCAFSQAKRHSSPVEWALKIHVQWSLSFDMVASGKIKLMIMAISGDALDQIDCRQLKR